MKLDGEFLNPNLLNNSVFEKYCHLGCDLLWLLREPTFGGMCRHHHVCETSQRARKKVSST
jgi:hypothetical protein